MTIRPYEPDPQCPYGAPHCLGAPHNLCGDCDRDPCPDHGNEVIQDAASQIMRALVEDATRGYAWGARLAFDVPDFSTVHEHCDANEYLQTVPDDCECPSLPAHHDDPCQWLVRCNAVLDVVNARIARGDLARLVGEADAQRGAVSQIYAATDPQTMTGVWAVAYDEGYQTVVRASRQWHPIEPHYNGLGTWSGTVQSTDGHTTLAEACDHDHDDRACALACAVTLAASLQMVEVPR